MGFQVDNNNFSNQQSRFYESNNCQYHNEQPADSTNPQQPSNDYLSNFFDLVSKILTSSNSLPGASNQLFQGVEPQKVEDYGGFKFKNEGEKGKVDNVLQQLRAEQAANPGKAVSKKFKIGKYKFKVSIDENGQVHIKKKKKSGLFGGFFKKVGGFLKKALPIISTIAMFIPGLQPLALVGRIASGVMGVVDGIKSGNIFGAVMSGVGALSGVGGKVSGFFSNLSSKASGFLGNAGTGLLSKIGGAGTWIQNAIGKGTSLLSQGKNWFSSFTNGIGGKVSDFVSGKGSGLLGNLSKSFGGNIGNWLTQKGPDLLKSFANSMGSRATNWLRGTANSFLAKLMDNPISRKVSGFMQSPFGQILVNMFRGGRA